MESIMHLGKIAVKQSELNLKMILEGGQCFRWKSTGNCEWTGVVSKALWILKHKGDCIEFKAVTTKDSGLVSVDACSEFLSDYLRLAVDIAAYYDQWSKADSHFENVASQCYGMRILNQDPVENLFSFICSSNNNIVRISSMVEKLCSLYGQPVALYNDITYHSFPEIASLASPAVDAALRKAGFGYRAKYIQQSAQRLKELGGKTWLEELKHIDYHEAKASLLQLQGIGPKVADCICLMSLGHLSAVPVDTHVFQIATQYYLPSLKSVKSVTDRVYNTIGDHFRDIYGPLAGWAHTVLFCAHLKMFSANDKQKRKKADNKENSVQDSDKSERLGKRKSAKDPHITSGFLNLTAKELNLRITLNSGQTYRFTEIENNVWRGIFGGKIWTLLQKNDRIEYTATWFPQENLKEARISAKQSIESECENVIRHFFRLDFPLLNYYEKWAKADKHFAEIAKPFCGLRMIRQDPVENTFAFICSSNNTILRIRKMVEALCTNYGPIIGEIDGVTYHDFPSVETLAFDALEDELKAANFGFRAKYVGESVKFIMKNGGPKWFENLIKKSYGEAKEELMNLPGVGAKVADCICLTALGHLNAIPVDTHVFQIAARYYLPHLKGKKTPTSKSYDEIGTRLREIFGDYAGWAHTVLFCSELKQHKPEKK